MATGTIEHLRRPSVRRRCSDPYPASGCPRQQSPANEPRRFAAALKPVGNAPAFAFRLYTRRGTRWHESLRQDGPPPGGGARAFGLRFAEDAARHVRAVAAARRLRRQRLHPGPDPLPEPTATRTLDSQQIVVKPTPQTIENLADSQWSDRLPRLVQLRLLQAFQNTGRIGAAGVPGQGLAIDYQVVTELRRFEIAFQPGPTAVVEISVKALNDKTGVVRGSRVFQAQVRSRRCDLRLRDVAGCRLRAGGRRHRHLDDPPDLTGLPLLVSRRKPASAGFFARVDPFGRGADLAAPLTAERIDSIDISAAAAAWQTFDTEKLWRQRLRATRHHAVNRRDENRRRMGSDGLLHRCDRRSCFADARTSMPYPPAKRGGLIEDRRPNKLDHTAPATLT